MVKYVVVDKPVLDPSARPVGVFQALAKGFDLVTAQPYLILPPLLLDLLLWFGPHLRLPSWLFDVFDSWMQMSTGDPEVVDQIQLARELFTDLFSRFNLIGLLTALPVGIPSMMFARLPVVSPLGVPPSVRIESGLGLLILWVGFMLLGQALGAQYHLWISLRLSNPGAAASAWIVSLRMVLVAVMLHLGIMFASLIFTLVATLFGILLPILAVVVAFLGLTFLFWSVVYLIFTPHGIVRYRLGIFRSMMESITLVRWNLMPTVGYLGLSLAILWITNQVWVLPEEGSWYSTLAILGHALVATTLIAGSYVLYQGRREWMLAQRKAWADRARQDQNGQWRA